jgi:phosphoglycolate phosphatase-like HAD superfamily hydrolase
VTQPDAELNEIISRSHHLFLDFDGPICAFFAGLPAGSVARDLRGALIAAGIVLPAAAEAQDDPLEVFRIVAGLGPEAAELAQRELTSLEILAVSRATPTPGATRLITTATQTGRTIAIISNNSGQAITAYLASHRLLGHVSSVFGRNDPDAAHMKPSP